MVGQRCVVFIIFALVMSIFVFLLWLFVTDTDEPKPLATCGGCHCIVGSGGDDKNATCPSRVPRTEYNDEIISTLRMQRPRNPFTLDCDPYDNINCEAIPQQEMMDLDDAAVCGLVYEFNSQLQDEIDASTVSAICPAAPLEYLMVTYASEAKALEDGAVITHVGACGVCSTTQDLAAYLSTPDMTTAAKECAKIAILKHTIEGLKCMADLGLSDSCAKIWLYNSENTGQSCGLQCITADIRDYANNGPAPECELNKCLQCDEEYSGPTFKRMAGRTRRRSGLLTAIARPCEELMFIEHDYACPIDANVVATAKSACLGACR